MLLILSSISRIGPRVAHTSTIILLSEDLIDDQTDVRREFHGSRTLRVHVCVAQACERREAAKSRACRDADAPAVIDTGAFPLVLMPK